MTLANKLKSGLKKLDDLEVRLFGNRVTVLGELLMINGVASMVNPNNSLLTGISVTGAYVGAILAIATDFGRITSDKYKEVECHIQFEGVPDKRFLSTLMRTKAKLTFCSYCDAQGVYLACRNTGYLEEFREVRKESANLIPNF